MSQQSSEWSAGLQGNNPPWWWELDVYAWQDALKSYKEGDWPKDMFYSLRVDGETNYVILDEIRSSLSPLAVVAALGLGAMLGFAAGWLLFGVLGLGT